MANQRIMRGAPATIGVTFFDQYGEGRNVTGVTVDVTRADGTSVLHETNLESNSETHEVSVELTPAQTANLDILLLRATTADGSVAERTIDIVGGFIFSASEAKAQTTTLAKYSDAVLRRVRDEVEAEAERYCNRAFSPRLVRLTVPWHNLQEAGRYVADRLAWHPVTINGRTFANPAAIGPIYSANGPSWLPDDLVTLFVEAGMTDVPVDFKAAAIDRAKDKLIGQGAGYDARASQMSNDQGTFTLVTAGVRGARTNSPDWNAALEDMRWDTGSVISVPIR